MWISKQLYPFHKGYTSLYGKLANHLGCVICAILVLFSFMITDAQAVGFRWIDKYNLTVGVWYPSPDLEAPVRLGPFDATLAIDGEPYAEKAQVILLSHGYFGFARNHHLTAKSLAEAGFIVIAPNHTTDQLIAGDTTATALEWRTQEVRHALEAVLQDDDLGDILDLSSVHMLGYSLGGLTAFYAAGATMDVSEYEQHCTSNEDPAFCETPSWLWRWRANRARKTIAPDFPRMIQNQHVTLGFITGGLAVVAPLGQGVRTIPNHVTAQSIFIVELTDDVVAKPEFHAREAARKFSAVTQTTLHRAEGHHYAFIAPFSDRVADKEHIEVAQDPEGFNRLLFLNDLNQDLVLYFRTVRNQTKNRK